MKVQAIECNFILVQQSLLFLQGLEPQFLLGLLLHFLVDLCFGTWRSYVDCLVMVPGLVSTVTQLILHAFLLVLSCFTFLFVCKPSGLIFLSLFPLFVLIFLSALYVTISLILPTLESPLVSTGLPSIVSIESYLCAYKHHL